LTAFFLEGERTMKTGPAQNAEPEPYCCWTITQPHWQRLASPFPEELAQRRPRYGWITVIVAGTLLAVAGLRWLLPWYVAAIGGVFVAASLLLALDKVDELRRRRCWRNWRRNWPERYEFVPGSARPSENGLRGYVIDPPGKDDIEAWQRFLAEMRDLPQHYAEVRWAVQKTEAELARRTWVMTS
jgi:hypothetical protein